MIRTSCRNQGGSFPGAGPAPEMKKDFRLKDGKADFEKLNDPNENYKHQIAQRNSDKVQ